jgi:predicted nucleic acid-binding protein
MRIIDFNHLDFQGFVEGEDILVDTGVLFAFYNPYDAYHSTVKQLFDKHILHNDKNLFLYINPTIVNEITYLASTPLKKYLTSFPDKANDFTNSDIENIEKTITNGIKELIENEVLSILDGDKESVIKQISLYKELGSADAVNASIANLYGISFLTVDKRLVENMFSQGTELPNITNVYYTTGKHRDY